jgi:hypothetical protein
MAFRCRICGCDAFEQVTVRRADGTLYRSSLLACSGCSGVFTDPERFSRPTEPPARVVSAPHWESRRTASRNRPDGDR